MARKRDTYHEKKTNIFIGLLLLIFAAFLFLSTFLSAPIFKIVNNFLGYAIFPVIFLILNVSLDNLGVDIGVNRFSARVAQILLIPLIAAVSYVAFTTVSPLKCIANNTIEEFTKNCNIEIASGRFFADILGYDGARMILIFSIILLIPVALNLDIPKIANLLKDLIEGLFLGFVYLLQFCRLALSKMFQLFWTLVIKLKEVLARKKENTSLTENSPQENIAEGWVNPTMRKKKILAEVSTREPFDGRIYQSDLRHGSEISINETSSQMQNNSDEEVVSVTVDPKSKSQTNLQEMTFPSEKVDDVTTIHNVSKDNSEEKPLLNTELRYGDWKLPPVKLLDKFEIIKPDKSDISKNIDTIERIYNSFGMRVEIVNAVIGPTVTQYQMNIAEGISVKNIFNRAADVCLALGVSGIRMEQITGMSLIGIEVPNKQRVIVKISEIMEELRKEFTKLRLGAVVGKSIDSKPVLVDIQKLPHLLVAGTTGSGKSVLTNSFIVSLLMTKSPDELNLILVDPKKVEFSFYNGIPHLLTPVIIEADKALNAMKWAVEEMERRYSTLSESKVKNIEGFNEKYGFTAMPYIIILIDEVADLMNTLGKAFEIEVLRLAQKARATGIHLILATQRPSVDVITGVLKGNIPGRIALKVAQQNDSRVIIDSNGAETLVGYGDMLYKDPAKPHAQRIQGVWVSEAEIQRIVDFIISQDQELGIEKTSHEEIITSKDLENSKEIPKIETGVGANDSLIGEAIRLINQERRFSTSMIQTFLGIGFNRAARIGNNLLQNGYVSKASNGKNYDINWDKISEYLGEASDQSSIAEQVTTEE